MAAFRGHRCTAIALIHLGNARVPPGHSAVEGSEDGGGGRAASGRERAIHDFISSSCTSGKKGTGAGRGCELRPAPRNQSSRREGLGLGGLVDLQPDAHGCPGKHGHQLWVRCGGGDNTRGGQPHRTFILRGCEPIPRCCDLQTVHRMKCWAPRGTDQRNHPGTGPDVRYVRIKRSVGTYPAERLLLSPSDLPECQPVILCLQRDQHGWRQRVPILSLDCHPCPLVSSTMCCGLSVASQNIKCLLC